MKELLSRKHFLNAAKGGAALALLSACAPNSLGSGTFPKPSGLSGKSKNTLSITLDVKRSGGSRWLWGNGKATPSSKARGRTPSVNQICTGDTCGGGDGGPGGDPPTGDYVVQGLTAYGYNASNASQVVDGAGNVIAQAVSSVSGTTLSTNVVGSSGQSATVTAPAATSIPMNTVVNVSASGTQGAQIYIDPSTMTGTLYLPDYGTTWTVTQNPDGSITVHPSDGSPDFTITPDQMIAMNKHMGYHTAVTGQCIANGITVTILVMMITALGLVFIISVRIAGPAAGVAATLNRAVWAARNGYLC